MEVAPLRVLIAEDDPAHAEAIRRAMGKANGAFEIRVVGTLREFLELASGDPPDMALMDLNLPDGRAIEVLTSPPESGPFPVLIMISYGSEQAAVEAMKAGALDYIVKSPDSFSDLPRILGRAQREWNLLQDHCRAEEALRVSEERYRDLVENSQDLICTHDLEGKLLSLNEAVSKQMGYDRESLLNRNLRDLLDPAVRHLFEGYLSEIRETGRSQGIMRLLNFAGEKRLWEYNNTLRTDGIAVPVVRSMAHDITERHRAEEALRESHKRFELANRATFDAIWDLDLETKVLWRNENFLTIFGYRAEEMESTIEAWTNRIHPEDLDRVKAGIYQAIDSGNQIWFDQYRFRRKDGRYATVEDRGHIHREAGGKPVRMIGAMQDITQRRQTEEALRQSEGRYRLLVENVNEAIVVAQDGRLQFVNPMACRLSGYSESELRAIPYAEIIYPDDRDMVAARHLERLQGHPVQERYLLRLKSKDGTVKWVEIGAVLIDWEGRPATLNLITDITDLKKAEADRERTEAEMRQAQKMEAVGRLAGGVAHDFNNMLGVILGYTDLALKRLNAQEPLYHDLQEVHNAARRSADLTRQLLAFSRKQIVTPKVINLNEALTQQQKMLGRLMGEDIHLKFIPGQDLWNIRMDSSQVDQILANLAVNARDAITGLGTVTIETANVTLDEGYTRRYPYAAPGDYVLLAVSDSGSGMDGETLERIFEPFFTTKGEGQGTGLGLSTVYGIVKQNGGSIQAYSEPGRGTTLKIYFPRFLGEAAPVEPVKETPFPGSETVLVVEDEPQILLLAKRILEHCGYKTVGAGSPGEALLVLEKHQGPLHLLLTDVIMPNMTGPELKERVEAFYPGIKTLFMSGYTAEVIAQRGLLEEGRAFIQKPFSVQDLMGKVREVLDS